MIGFHVTRLVVFKDEQGLWQVVGTDDHGDQTGDYWEYTTIEEVATDLPRIASTLAIDNNERSGA